jgi:curved DNA-binding protein CbpA
MTNYYAILEVKDFAPPETIKKAHRRLSMLYHPDRNNGDKLCEEKFKQVQNAYEHLSDPYHKMLHDERLNSYYTTGQDTSNYYYHFATEQQERASARKTKYHFFVPWGLVVAFIGWIINGINNTNEPSLKYDDVKVIYNYPGNTSGQDSALTVLFSNQSQANNARNTIPAAQTTGSNYFTIGSSQQTVAEVQGEPLTIEPGYDVRVTWHYGKSYVQFENSIVSGYSNADKNLQVEMLPSSLLTKENKDSTFSIGSTKEQVLLVQGTPVSANANFILHQQTWYYGSSIITFRNDVVVSFINNGALKVK